MPADRVSEVTKFVCECGTALSSSSSLSRHRRIHGTYAERKYGCPYLGCGYRSNQTNGVKSHVKYKHEKNSDLQWTSVLEHFTTSFIQASLPSTGEPCAIPSTLPPANYVIPYGLFGGINLNHPAHTTDVCQTFEASSWALPPPNYTMLGGTHYATDVHIGCPSRGDETSQIAHQLAYNNANFSEATSVYPFAFPYAPHLR